MRPAGVDAEPQSQVLELGAVAGAPATNCATVPFPEADGPSMAMTGAALTA